MKEVCTTNTKVISIRVVAAKENIEATIKLMVADLSADFELLKSSKPYPSRHNSNEVRVYLEFIKKKNTDEGAQPNSYDVVKGGGNDNNC